MADFINQYPWVVFIVTVAAAAIILRTFRSKPEPAPTINKDILPLGQLRLWQALIQVNHKDWVALPEVKLASLFRLPDAKRYRARLLEKVKPWTLDFVLIDSASGKPMVAVCIEDEPEAKSDDSANESGEEAHATDPFAPLAEMLEQIHVPLIVVAEQEKYCVRELRRSIQGALEHEKAA